MDPVLVVFFTIVALLILWPVISLAKRAQRSYGLRRFIERLECGSGLRLLSAVICEGELLEN